MGGEPTRRQRRGDEFVEQGRLDEALDEYLWCWDNGKLVDPPYTGVRSSFLLADIEKLFDRLPRARAELANRREAAKQRVLQDRNDRDAAGDFATLGHRLGEDVDTLALFDQLRSDGRLTQRVEQALGYHLVELFIERRRYAHILSTQRETALEVVRSWIGMHRDGDARSAQVMASINSRIKGTAREHLAKRNDPALERRIAELESQSKSADAARLHKKVTNLANFYEAELGAGSAEQADQIAELVLDYAPNSRAHAELIRRAVRAGSPDRARLLANRAFQTFPSEEHALIRAALESPAQ